MASFSDLAPDASGPAGSFLGKYYCRLLLGPYTRTRPFATSSWTPQQVVFLPIPKDLADDTSVNYSETNLEGVGDIINLDPGGFVGRLAFGQGGAQLLEAGASATAAAFGGPLGLKILDKVKEVSGVNTQNITSAIQAVSGYSPNPNPAVLFSGPELREFTFSWAFYPKTKEESYHIDKTIKTLKKAALPKPFFGNATGTLEYPYLCQINFFPWDEGGGSDSWGWTGNSIIRIKKCFMKSVRVNYSDFGNPAFFEGTNLPIMYRLNITLQETEYMLSDDWSDKPNTGKLAPGESGSTTTGGLSQLVNVEKNTGVAGTLGGAGGPKVFTEDTTVGAEGDPNKK